MIRYKIKIVGIAVILLSYIKTFSFIINHVTQLTSFSFYSILARVGLIGENKLCNQRSEITRE